MKKLCTLSYMSRPVQVRGSADNGMKSLKSVYTGRGDYKVSAAGLIKRHQAGVSAT